MRIYPIPYMVTSIRTDLFGNVDVSTVQIVSGNVSKFETCLFWDANNQADPGSSIVAITFTRAKAASNHRKWLSRHAVEKEIKKVINSHHKKGH